MIFWVDGVEWNWWNNIALSQDGLSKMSIRCYDTKYVKTTNLEITELFSCWWCTCSTRLVQALSPRRERGCEWQDFGENFQVAQFLAEFAMLQEGITQISTSQTITGTWQGWSLSIMDSVLWISLRQTWLDMHNNFEPRRASKWIQGSCCTSIQVKIDTYL